MLSYDVEKSGGASAPFVQEHLGITDMAVLSADSVSAMPDGDYVHFKPLAKKGPNYLSSCVGWLAKGERPNQKEMVDTVVAYTSTKVCYQVNFALATDWGPKLSEHQRYIRRLKYCIGKMPGWNGPLWRGLDLSDVELQTMKDLGRFYIPSFTSATKNKKKAFGGGTVLAIDAASATWTLEMTKELSPVYFEEEEVLLTCNTLFDYKSSHIENGKTVVNLKVVRQ